MRNQSLMVHCAEQVPVFDFVFDLGLIGDGRRFQGGLHVKGVMNKLFSNSIDTMTSMHM